MNDEATSPPPPGEPPAGISRTLYRELEHRARALLRQRRVAWTPETDSLVNRACAKILKADGPPPEDRARFLAFAAATLRNVLIDLARERAALRRGGGRDPATLDEQRVAPPPGDAAAVLVLDVDEKLKKLARHDPWLSRLVELRFFGDLTWPEVSEVAGKLQSEVQRDWEFVRIWMRSELGDSRDASFA